MKYFVHGDKVCDEDLNQIVDAINNAQTDFQMSSYVFGCLDAYVAGTIFQGIHTNRWFVYRSTGELRSMDYVVDSDPMIGHMTVLPDCNDLYCIFDLHTVEWLKYGDVYLMEGSEFGLEVAIDA